MLANCWNVLVSDKLLCQSGLYLGGFKVFGEEKPKKMYISIEVIPKSFCPAFWFSPV